MEELLIYVWKHKLMQMYNLHTTSGTSIEIIDVGQHNTDAGPDFFNAKIRIGSIILAGNIEIHTRSSDWFKHRHDQNRVYNSVILHVVQIADTEVSCENGHTPPQLVLNFPQSIKERYQNLQKASLPCQPLFPKLKSIDINLWKDRLLSERLERKTEKIIGRLEKNRNNWEETLYLTLAYYWGFGINNEAFEAIATHTPLSCIIKHRNSLFQLEALLLGQAGLLEETDEYTRKLIKEYRFLQNKFKLIPIDKQRWKMHRMRPFNFPHLRIAEFAAFMQQAEGLFSQISECENIHQLRTLFAVSVSDYWETHYSFAHRSPLRKKRIGTKTIDLLLINVVVPILFSYGIKTDDLSKKEKAFAILEQLPAEQNRITKMWAANGFEITNAYDSQAFIQLNNEYCNVKKCLYCQFGYKLLTASNG